VSDRTCSIDGCNRPHYSRTWCSLHYGRWYQTGDPLRNATMAQVAREDATGERVCTVCGRSLPMDQYRKGKRSLNGRQRECKECFAQRVKSWYLESGRTRVNANSRRNHLLRTYGLTADEFHAMLTAQGECCAVCGTGETRLFVDHDHVTGQVRSLLCHHCNLALGFVGDSIDRLHALVSYLQSHGY
jgi:Recombination endonuclease VII